MPTTRTVETTTVDEATAARRREAERQREQARRLKYPSAWHDPNYYADPRNAAPATFLLSKAARSPYPELAWNRQSLAAAASTLGPEAEQMLNSYVSRGVVTPQIAAGLADVAKVLQLPDETLDAMSTLDNVLNVASGETADKSEVTNSETEKGRLARMFGSVTRPLFAMLSLPAELVQGNIRELAGNISEADGAADVLGAVGEFVNPFTGGPLEPSEYDQTVGGQFIRGIIDPNFSADLGDGWFPNGEAAVRAENAKAEAAPLIHGEHWTLGRWSASLNWDDPDSRMFRSVSGFVDLVSAIALDPLVLTGVGAAGTRVAQAGARTAAVTERAVRARAAVAEDVLRQPETWIAPKETFAAATEHVRAATQDFVAATKAHGWDKAGERLATATDRYDDTIDSLVLATSDAAAPRTLLDDAEIASRVRSATENVGNEAIGAFSARISGEAPPVKGVVTDATPENGSSIIGSSSGVDTVVTVTKPDFVTASTDDLADFDDMIRIAKTIGGPKQARNRLITQIQKVRERGDVSLGDVVDAAARTRTSGALAAVLREQGIDGVTDLFRLTGSEGGVWWTTREVDAVTRQADGTWAHVASDGESLTARIDNLKAAQRSAASQRGKATQDANNLRAAAESSADEFGRIMDGLTDLDASSATGVRTAIEYAMGVRHKLGGKPSVDHTAIQSFLFGTRAEGDAALGAVASTKSKAIRAADRAMIAGATFGFSEAARGAAKLFTPVMANLRTKILDDMVRMDDTAENLGKLHRLTNGKIDGQVLRQALQATNHDEVLEAFAPHLGVQITRPITPNIVNLARARLTDVSTGRRTDTLLQRGMRFMIDEAERLGTIAPRGMVSLNFADPLGSSRDLLNYLDNIPGLDAKVTDQIMGRYLQAVTETGRARAVMQGFDKVHEALAARTAAREGWSPETVDTLNKALKDAVQVYDGGRADVTTWWAKRHTADATTGYISVDGTSIPLPGPQLEAELARGGVVLPSSQQLRRAIGRYGAFIQEGKLGPVPLGQRAATLAKNTGDVVSAFNDLWRSSVLFRPAYVLRNIGEMQSRMFLAGHSSVFSHPMAVAAFALSAPVGRRHTLANIDPIRNLAERFNRANKTATGHSFSEVSIDDLNSADEALQLFAESTLSRTSRLDMRTHRAMEAFHGLESVRIDQPGFNMGWADQLLTLRSSRVARIVAGVDPDEVARAVAKGADREDAVVSWMLSSPEARPIRQMFADNDPVYARMFGNPRTGTGGDPNALKQFLFTAEGSIQKRLDYYVRGNEEIADFIRTGVLTDREGNEAFNMTIAAQDATQYGAQMAERNRRLARKLEQYRKSLAANDPDTAVHMRVLRAGRGEEPFKLFDTVFDSFFNWAGRMENAWSVGPEFAFAYHGKLAELLPAVQAGSRQQVFDVIKGAEGKTRILSETMIAARSGLKAKGAGTLTVDDVSAMAARHASEHVKTFFYDAMRRQQIFHAMRVVWPFAQSFVDTLWRWGTLAAKRPYMLEKVGRLGTALQEPGSNVIYDNFDFIDPFTNRQSYDPTQGVLWNHPQTGERMLSFPLIGSMLGAPLSPVAGAMTGENINLAEAMQLSAPLRNLNIALQGDVDYLPGVGPLLTFPSSVFFQDDWFGAFPEWLRTYLFPYGKPPLSTEGILESGFFPTPARRFLGFLGNDEQRNYAVKGTMAYLLSTREYSGFRDDPAVAQQLIDDTGAGASSMALIRAIGAAFLPAAPGQEIFAADRDGNWIASVHLADRWHHILQNNGRDTEAAIVEMGQTYGLETLAAVAGPSSEGDVPFSGPAWEFFKTHVETAEPYSDVLGYFFPGDYSYESNEWVRNSKNRRTLSIQERTDNVREFLYFAERRQIEGRAAQQRWNPDQLRSAFDELDRTYADVIPTFEVGRLEIEIEKVRRALENLPDLAQTRGGQGTQLIFESYDEYKGEAERRFGPGATLTSQRAGFLRESFLRELDSITAQYGGQNLERGSVETIAQMFSRLVEPQGE